MRLSYLVWFLFLAVVSWQDFQKQEISSWLLILMGALGTVIQLFEGSVSLGGWFTVFLPGLSIGPRNLSAGERKSSDFPEGKEKLPPALCAISAGRFSFEFLSVRRIRMKKGSYTVEAALLMGVLIPLLVGVIYLGFFMMIRGNVQGEAIEKALTALLIGEETEGVSLGEKEVSVEAEAAVPAFPFGKRVFSLADSVQGRFVLERQKSSETIFRMHSLKKAIRQVKKE